MKLKAAILSVLGRDRLKVIADSLGLDGVDRRSVERMRVAVSRARRATPELLLDFLLEGEVRRVCELYGVSAKGRRAQLVRRLLEEEEGATQAPIGRSRTRGRSPRTLRPDGASRGDEDVPEELEGSRSEPVRLPEPPPGMIRIGRTELVWPGKYNEDGTAKQVPRVHLPFQVIERVNESRAAREARNVPQVSLFDVYEGKEGDTFEEGWRNKLVWGDNLLAMGSLLDKFAGKIDLIYIDPPFATGADFSFATQVGDGGVELTKEQSIIEEKAYRDTWGQGNASYLDMLSQRLVLIRELLSLRGSLYVHMDWHLVQYARAILDEVFGVDNFVNEIIRVKSNPKNFPQPQFGNFHDTILFYAVDRVAKVWHPPSQSLTEDQAVADFPLVDPSTGRRYKTDPLHAPASGMESPVSHGRGCELPRADTGHIHRMR